MNELDKVIKDLIDEDISYVKSLRRHFHEFPELSKCEFNTALKIEEELDKIGLPHERVGDTGVIAYIDSKKEGKTIILRADIDALPIEEMTNLPYKSKNKGVMHACGHDLHTASLIGALRVLVKMKDKIKGKIIAVFEQAEEVGYGGSLFVKSGLLNNANRSFGIHVASEIEVGKIAVTKGPQRASVDHFKIEINGKTSHVSKPDLGVDALYIGSLIVTALQALVTRKTNPLLPCVIGIGKFNSGTAYNVVSDKAELEGTLRCLTKEVRENLKKDILDTVKNISSIFGATYNVLFDDFSSPLINDIKSTEECQKVADRVFGSDNVIKDFPANLAGDDMSEIINLVPGLYAYIGTSNKTNINTLEPIHSNKFEIDELALNNAILLYSSYAISYLNQDF